MLFPLQSHLLPHPALSNLTHLKVLFKSLPVGPLPSPSPSPHPLYCLYQVSSPIFYLYYTLLSLSCAPVSLIKTFFEGRAWSNSPLISQMEHNSSHITVDEWNYPKNRTLCSDKKCNWKTSRGQWALLWPVVNYLACRSMTSQGQLQKMRKSEGFCFLVFF